jgi:hypothetical protein
MSRYDGRILQLQNSHSGNWLVADPDSTIFSKVSHTDGTVTPMSGQEWLSLFLDPTLSKSVPENVRTLFEVARGSLAYGYFFNPLYKKLQFLFDRRVLSEEERLDWDAVRQFRNSTSHPQQQMILPPGAVASLLGSIGETINKLFA